MGVKPILNPNQEKRTNFNIFNPVASFKIAALLLDQNQFEEVEASFGFVPYKIKVTDPSAFN